MMISNGFRFAVALMLAMTFPAVSYAVDQENQPSKQSEVPAAHDVPDIGGAGVLDYSYELDVPVFHGAEPKLSFSYASSLKTRTSGLYQGWLGYGWSFRGFDVIERARHKGTVPAFDGATPDKDGTDVFLLNGEELIKCGDANNSSASCTAQNNAADTYVSETENYLRISRDRTNNAWTITNRQGATMVLRSANFFATDATNEALAKYARWFVKSITDANGNTVTYDYSCPIVPVCYPKTISYNTTTIKFYLEDRPDHIVRANGQAMSVINRRITSIGITNGANLVAAYKFSYVTAPGSGASRLATISRYGTNASVDTNGAVTRPNGGLAPKMTSFGYSDYAGLMTSSSIDSMTNMGGVEDLYPVDVDSDGVTELLEKQTINSGGDCRYRLFNLKPDNTFARLDMDPTVFKCFALVGHQQHNTPQFFPVNEMPAFSLGHFGNDTNDTQLLFRDNAHDGDNLDSKTYLQATFKKDGDTFIVKSKNCADIPSTDAIKAQCGKKYPNSQVIDFDGNGTDKLDSTAFDSKESSLGAVNLFGNGKEQQVFIRDGGLKIKTSANDTALTMVLKNFSCDTAQCFFADMNGDGLDDFVSIFHKTSDASTNTCAWVADHCNVMGSSADDDNCADECAWMNVYLNVGGLVDGNTFVWVLKKKFTSRQAIVAVRDIDGDGKAEIIMNKGWFETLDANLPADDQALAATINKASNITYVRLTKDSSGYHANITDTGFSAIPVQTGDFNGDGLADFIWRGPLLKNGKVIDSTSDDYNTYQALGEGRSGWLFLEQKFYADLKDASNAIPYRLTLSKSSSAKALPNVLTSITTELGASSTFEYTASTAYKNTYLPFVVPTVTKMTVNDGRNTTTSTATTTYAYTGAWFHTTSRKFFGFKTSTKTLPKAAGESVSPYVTTAYRQDAASYGLAEKVEYYDGAGTLRKIENEEWSVDGAHRPYYARSISTVTTFNEASLTRKLKTERSYDIYGNITETRNLGLINADGSNIPGDESRINRNYQPNTTKYIVSLPYRVTTSNGLLSSADVIAQTDTWYGSVDINGPPNGQPSTANIMQTAVYRNASVRNHTTYAYDNVGNKKRETALGASGEKLVETLWDYGDAQQILPTKMQNWISGTSNYLTTTYVNKHPSDFAGPDNNFLCQKPWTETDPNGVVTEYTFEVFCRTKKVENQSTNNYTATTYLNDADPATQQVIIETPMPDASDGSTRVAQKIEFYDGLGRVYKTQTAGDASSPTALVDTVYDGRSNVWKISLPHGTSAAAVFTINTYDWNNRVVKSVIPDGTANGHLTTWDYSLAASTNTDNAAYNGNSFGDLGNPSADSWNLLLAQVTVTEDINAQSDQVTETTYTSDGDVARVRTKLSTDSGFAMVQASSFDDLGRLVRVRDPGNATWLYAYDWAGNRTSVTDPDMGYWTYQCDRANRLFWQQDARNIISEIDYDGLGRVTARRANRVTIVSNTYDQVRAGVFNKGQLTAATNGRAPTDKDYAAQTFDYDENGMVTKKVSTIAYNTNTTITHTEETGYYRKSKLVGWKIYNRGGTAELAIGDTNTRWTYNTKGQLRKVPGFVLDTLYELDGQTDSIIYASNVTTDFTYDLNRRWLATLSTKKSGGFRLIDNAYTRDGLGRIQKIDGFDDNNNGVADDLDDWTYDYDARDRLLFARNARYPGKMNEDFTYDASGNLTLRHRQAAANDTTITYANSRPHAISTVNGSASYLYDNNGNVTNDRTQTYTWDDSNRLKTVTKGTAITDYVYGPDGARVKKVAPTKLVTLYPDVNVEISQLDSSTWNYIRYPHMDVKIEITGGQTKRRFLHRDHLASVREITDFDAVKDPGESTVYKAYGEGLDPATGNAPTAANRNQKNYINERFDPDTGLVYLNARYMNSVTGRFVPADE